MNLLCAIFLRIFQSSYYRSSGHVVSESRISFGNNHFGGELINLFTSTGIIIANLQFIACTGPFIFKYSLQAIFKYLKFSILFRKNVIYPTI